ncbi:MAG: hypothetical protein R3C55_04530 [Parvularculaceae bacterium]
MTKPSFEKVRKPAQVLENPPHLHPRRRLEAVDRDCDVHILGEGALQGSLGVSSASESRMLPASDFRMARTPRRHR